MHASATCVKSTALSKPGRSKQSRLTLLRSNTTKSKATCATRWYALTAVRPLQTAIISSPCRTNPPASGCPKPTGFRRIQRTNGGKKEKRWNLYIEGLQRFAQKAWEVPKPFGFSYTLVLGH